MEQQEKQKSLIVDDKNDYKLKKLLCNENTIDNLIEREFPQQNNAIIKRNWEQLKEEVNTSMQLYINIMTEGIEISNQLSENKIIQDSGEIENCIVLKLEKLEDQLQIHNLQMYNKLYDALKITSGSIYMKSLNELVLGLEEKSSQLNQQLQQSVMPSEFSQIQNEIENLNQQKHQQTSIISYGQTILNDKQMKIQEDQQKIDQIRSNQENQDKSFLQYTQQLSRNIQELYLQIQNFQQLKFNCQIKVQSDEENLVKNNKKFKDLNKKKIKNKSQKKQLNNLKKIVKSKQGQVNQERKNLINYQNQSQNVQNEINSKTQQKSNISNEQTQKIQRFAEETKQLQNNVDMNKGQLYVQEQAILNNKRQLQILTDQLNQYEDIKNQICKYQIQQFDLVVSNWSYFENIKENIINKHFQLEGDAEDQIQLLIKYREAIEPFSQLIFYGQMIVINQFFIILKQEITEILNIIKILKQSSFIDDLLSQANQEFQQEILFKSSLKNVMSLLREKIINVDTIYKSDMQELINFNPLYSLNYLIERIQNNVNKEFSQDFQTKSIEILQLERQRIYDEKFCKQQKKIDCFLNKDKKIQNLRYFLENQQNIWYEQIFCYQKSENPKLNYQQ